MGRQKARYCHSPWELNTSIYWLTWKSLQLQKQRGINQSFSCSSIGSPIISVLTGVELMICYSLLGEGNVCSLSLSKAPGPLMGLLMSLLVIWSAQIEAAPCLVAWSEVGHRSPLLPSPVPNRLTVGQSCWSICQPPTQHWGPVVCPAPVLLTPTVPWMCFLASLWHLVSTLSLAFGPSGLGPQSRTIGHANVVRSLMEASMEFRELYIAALVRM